MRDTRETSYYSFDNYKKHIVTVMKPGNDKVFIKMAKLCTYLNTSVGRKKKKYLVSYVVFIYSVLSNLLDADSVVNCLLLDQYELNATITC